jgi:predicted deacylase
MANVPDLPALVAAAAPGERHAALLATPTDPPTEVPAIALRGARPGPTLLVTAGVHGAEYASIEAAYRLAALEPSELSGVLIVLPIVNRPAYRVRAIYGNPVDGKNLNRQFPGDPAGSFAPRLAHWLTDAWVRHADAYLDLHGGDLNEALTPFVLHARGDERARALAEAFGIPYVVASGSAGHSYTAAAALGVPAVLAEAGGQGLFPESDVLTLVDGAHRAMRHLGMLAGAPTPRPTVPIDAFVVLTSDHEGRWYPRVRLDARVEAGQPLGEVRDLLGNVIQEATAPVSGTVLYYVATLAIDRGDPLVGIGATAQPH